MASIFISILVSRISSTKRFICYWQFTAFSGGFVPFLANRLTWRAGRDYVFTPSFNRLFRFCFLPCSARFCPTIFPLTNHDEIFSINYTILSIGCWIHRSAAQHILITEHHVSPFISMPLNVQPASITLLAGNISITAFPWHYFKLLRVAQQRENHRLTEQSVSDLKVLLPKIKRTQLWVLPTALNFSGYFIGGAFCFFISTICCDERLLMVCCERKVVAGCSLQLMLRHMVTLQYSMGRGCG